jgi:hypothetical protein
MFLDVNGNDLVLPLTNFALDNNAIAKSFVNGYGFKFSTTNTTYAVTPDAAYLFQFSDGTNIVYVYIPVTTTGNIYNPDVVDLTAAGGAVANFVVPSSGSAVPLTPFNMVNENTYNQWYTSNVGTSSILVSNFIYKVPAANVAAAITNQAAWQVTMLTNTNWNTALATNSAKLCYASTITTGNVSIILSSSKRISEKACLYGLHGSGPSSIGSSSSSQTASTLRSSISTSKITSGPVALFTHCSI